MMAGVEPALSTYPNYTLTGMASAPPEQVFEWVPLTPDLEGYTGRAPYRQVHYLPLPPFTPPGQQEAQQTLLAG